jgi:hypothetical protein
VRRSLREYNAIAVYLQWVRQAHYLRDEAGPQLSSSIGSVAASDTEQQQAHPFLSPMQQVDMRFDVVHDLLGFGAWFDEAETGGRVVGYASELEILG